MNRLEERCEHYSEYLPTVYDYRLLLKEIMDKTGISHKEAIEKYGQFTYGEWGKLLSEVRNKT